MYNKIDQFTATAEQNNPVDIVFKTFKKYPNNIYKEKLQKFKNFAVSKTTFYKDFRKTNSLGNNKNGTCNNSTIADWDSMVCFVTKMVAELLKHSAAYSIFCKVSEA